MQSHFESPLASETDSSLPVTANAFPIHRLPDEILSRVIDVGSWDDHNINPRAWIYDTKKPRQKNFVRIASQVCCRWREITQWQGHPHRWSMCLMFTCNEVDNRVPDFSGEFSRFRWGLRASDGCDLLVRLTGWTVDPDSDLQFDDPAVVHMQLFMHGIKMLLPYLPQILVLDVHICQSDPLHLLFGMLQRWTTRSRLTRLSISYVGDEGECMRESPSSLSEFQLLGLRGSKNVDDRLLHSLPPTLAHVSLSSVSLPKTFVLPYGLKHLAIARSDFETDYHSLIPHTSHLTWLHLDLRNEAAPSRPFLLDSLVTFMVVANLRPLLDWSQMIYAKSLKHLFVFVSDEEPCDFSPPPETVRSRPLLSPTVLNVSCAAGALLAILNCLAISDVALLTISFENSRLEGQDDREIQIYPELPLCDKEISLPLVQTLGLVVTNGETWSQSLKGISFPALESLSYTRSSSESSLAKGCDETLYFAEWMSFSSDHEGNSFDNLVKLNIRLPAFEDGQYYPFEHFSNIVELEVEIIPWRSDWEMWMKYPGTHSSPHPPLLSRLRRLTVSLRVEREATVEDILEAQINAIQASRAQHGAGLERVCILWNEETTEFRQNVRTGVLERVLSSS